jgi:hypothetical protein
MNTVIDIDPEARRRGCAARSSHPAAGRSSHSPDPRATRSTGPQPTRPDPQRFVAAVARAFLEIEAGLRPLSQLTPLLCPALDLRLAPTIHRNDSPLPSGDAVVSVRCQRLPDDRIDAAVVVRRGGRFGVLAMRVERHQGAWRIVELARPEDGRPPPDGPVGSGEPTEVADDLVGAALRSLLEEEVTDVTDDDEPGVGELPHEPVGAADGGEGVVLAPEHESRDLEL